MDWKNARTLGGRKITKPAPRVDTAVSKIVGRNISTTDPRLIKFVVDKKRELGEEISVFNMMQTNEVMKKELKEALK